MAHEVFISYTTLNKTAADAVCAGLEREKLRCWMAPRDVLPGSNYGESIVNAIESARVVVLIFSSASNLSPAVQREMERAMHFAKPIIPFRLEDVPMTKGMEFYLASCHWLDAMSPPIERHIGQLASAVHALLGNEWSRPAEPSSPIRRSRRPLIAAAVLIGLIALIGVFLFSRRPTPSAIKKTASSPVLTGLSLDVQVRNPGEEPIRDAFNATLASLTRVRYEISREEKLLRIKPVCAYLERLTEKDSILPVWPASETGAPHFETVPVVLVLQLLNDTAKALSVHRVELQVSESESEDRPLPVFVLDPNGLRIVNDGWAPLENASLQITSPENARGAVTLAKLENARLVRWAEMSKTASAATVARELKCTLEYFWFAKDGVRYSAISTFQVKPDEPNPPHNPIDVASTAAPPPRLELEVDKSDYRVTGPLARQVAPGEHDTVEVSLSAPRTSRHRFHLLVHYNDGQDGVLRSPEIDLEYFAPRSVAP
jgi:hypothetical protein